jgi:hypothetical protein
LTLSGTGLYGHRYELAKGIDTLNLFFALDVHKNEKVDPKTTDKQAKIKYNFSNGGINLYSHKEYAYFVAQCYWVERTFCNVKNELGILDHQTRGWKSWHYHHVLFMLASLFIMKQQMDNQSDAPLLRFRDARILVILQVIETSKDIKL